MNTCTSSPQHGNHPPRLNSSLNKTAIAIKAAQPLPHWPPQQLATATIAATTPHEAFVPMATTHRCTTITATHLPSASATRGPPCHSSAACHYHSAVSLQPTSSSGGHPCRSHGRPIPPCCNTMLRPPTSAVTSPARPPPAPLAVPSYAACRAVAKP
jgi:hypothetical protein